MEREDPSSSPLLIIPNDITAAILSRLPVSSLLRFRLVCRGWCSLIDSKDFVETHLLRAKQNQEPSFVIEMDEELRFFDTNNPLFRVEKETLWQPVPTPPSSEIYDDCPSILSW
jgi:hypothetical protein